MKTDLLKEWISLIVEKIRTEKGKKSKFGDKFSLNTFKTLDGVNIMLDYASQFLEALGEGSSRKAFLLSGKYVLKIALNEKGLAQNQAEMDVFTNPKSQAIVAKVYSYDPKFQWLISDLVKPLTNINEFESLAGISWKVFREEVADGIEGQHVAQGGAPFVKSVLYTALHNKLMKGDLIGFVSGPLKDARESILSHWGKTPDGRIVLLDYGFTHEVWNDHYKQKKANGPAEPEATAKMAGRPQPKAQTKRDGSPPKKFAPGGTLESPAGHAEDPALAATVKPSKKKLEPEDDQRTKR